MILVSGGAGYIGSHTVAELLAGGHDVVVVDNLCNSDISAIASIEKISGVKVPLEIIDLKDKEKVLALANKYPITGVIHFAAYKAVGESVDNPLMYYENNLLSLMNIIALMEKVSCKNLIFSSSCTVYGDVTKIPVDESFPIQKAFSPYGSTKIMCETIIEDCTKTKTISSISLRYFNPIGAHPTLHLGENPKNVSNLLPVIIKAAKGEIPYVSVFGNDYETPDGSCIRDYIHVMDLASAHVAAMERMMSGNMENDFEYYNLGSENGYSVLEMISTFEKVNQVKVNYKIEKRREGDVEKIYSDSSLAKEKLHWKSKYKLEQMLSSAWERDKLFKS